jgi:hypothetical protein
MELQKRDAPVPVYLPVQKTGSGFGTVMAAMLTGAFITVSLLYMWGADVSREQEAIGATAGSPAR